MLSSCLEDKRPVVSSGFRLPLCRKPSLMQFARGVSDGCAFVGSTIKKRKMS